MHARSRTRRLSSICSAAIMVVGYLTSGASFGLHLQSLSPAVDVRGVTTVEPEEPVIAPIDEDTFVELTPAQIDVFDNNSTPLEPEDAHYPANVALSPQEVADRQDEMADEYEVGEPLSLEDLEFLRAYLLDEAAEPGVATAGFTSGEARDDNAAIAALSVETASMSTSKFNQSKTANGSSVNATGSSTLRISQPSPIENGWSAKWTAKRTAGASLTKIKNTVSVQAYGAVAQWPFVGLIYSVSRSSTSHHKAQSWSLQRSENFGGAVIQLNIQCYSYFYNSRGSFQLP